jgi:hypothetical protein
MKKDAQNPKPLAGQDNSPYQENCLNKNQGNLDIV